MEKTMIIVGAGIAGLSTGCYARLNGYKTIIYEMHNIPGGLCTAWKRKGYTFDISMHLLTNSKQGPFRKLWEELGVVRNQEFFYHDKLAVIEGEGKKLDLCVDRKKLEEQMLVISPADSKLIREFVDLFCGPNLMNAATMLPSEVMGIGDKLKMFFSILPLIGLFKKYAKVSIQEFANRFKDPFLARAVRYSIDSPGWPMVRFPMIGLAGFSQSAVTDAGYPSGGSQKVIFKLAEYYKQLGGEVHYKNRVKDVIVKNDTASGVRLEDGSIHNADAVVWAGDGHHLIYDILAERYIDDNLRKIYREWIPVQPLVHVMFGVNMDLSKEPHRIIMEIDKPVIVAGEEFKWLSIMSHCFDPKSAPPGKSAIEVWYATKFDYWQELAKDRMKYDEEKKRIADATADALEKRWPGFKSRIEVTDVPTPMTYVRYTGNWKGSPDGWYITVENIMNRENIRYLPGLKNLFMVGQWTAPYTGTIMAALSGRQLIQILCKKDRKQFVTALPKD